MAMNNLAEEKVWCDKSLYDKAECSYFENLAKSVQGRRVPTSSDDPASGSLADEVAKARQRIKQGLQCVSFVTDDGVVSDKDLSTRMAHLEKDNQDLRNIVNRLSNSLAEVNQIVEKLDKLLIGSSSSSTVPHLAVCPAKPPSKPTPAKTDDDDDDVDLFGSDSEGEDAEAAKIREKRLEAYAAKKSKKPALIAKSNIIFDVKPWDDETDMAVMESKVREIVSDGLLWGASKLVPLAYGIQKLQISCVLEDEKVSVDWLTETIEGIEDLVQSVDIAAFNKV